MHNQIIIEDKCARLVCAVSGAGTLEIVWYKDGKKIDFEEDLRVLDYTDVSDYTGCIGIECAKPSDSGNYKCVFTCKEKNVVLETSCDLRILPRIRVTKELAQQIAPTIIRKLQCECIF